MDTVTISPKYQVVIPRQVRERMRSMRGFFRKFDRSFKREKEDRV